MLDQQSKDQLLAAANANPDLTGFGVLVIDGDETYWLRRVHDTQTPTIVYRIIYEESDSFWSELLNCGLTGASCVISWIGALAFSAAAPVTGGGSVPAAYAAAAAAGATTVAFAVSVTRVYNAVEANHINEALDADGTYVTTMRVIDIISLLSAAISIKQAMTAASNLSQAGVPLSQVGAVNRHVAKRLVAQAEQQGVKGAARGSFTGGRTAMAVKQQIVGAVSSSITALSSITGGVIKEVRLALVGPAPGESVKIKAQFVGPKKPQFVGPRR